MTPHEKKLNREKVKRHYWKHRVRLRHEGAEKRRLADAWKPPASGNWSVAIQNGKPCVVASGGVSGAIVTGLGIEAAGRIAAGLRKLLGHDHRRRPRPHCGKGGRPVERLHPNGTVERFDSITAAARVMGVDRMVITRRVCDGRPDHDGCTWSDCKA